MNARTTSLGAALATAAAAITASAALAGDLNPPPGPIAPTGFTIAEIKAEIDAITADAEAANDTLLGVRAPTDILSLPSAPGADFVISEPGRYVLTANYFTETDTDVIEIQSSNVIVDLKGFAIIGNPAINYSSWAVTTTAGVDNVAVVNGTISYFGGGVRLLGEGNVVRDVRVYAGQGAGIDAGGNSAIERCTVHFSGAGISAGFSSTIKDCAVQGSFSHGFSLESGSVIENCTADNGVGVGIEAGQGTVIDGCVATRNGGYGYDLFGSTIRESVAHENTEDGVRAYGSTMFAVHSSNNEGVGFTLLAGNHVTRCAATSNDVGGFLISGVRNHVASNYAAEQLGGAYAFRVDATATDCFVVSNFAHANSSYYEFNTTNGALGDRKINLTGAAIWDNFSN